VFFSCRMSVFAVKSSVRSTWSVESPEVAVAHMGADEVSGEVVIVKSLSYILLLMVPEQV
jgi:hypothetical protein